MIKKLKRLRATKKINSSTGGGKMKEKIIIELKNMKAGMPELDKLVACQNIEQVPETFKELKYLCKELKEKINKEIWEMKIEEDVIHIRRIWETKEICFTNAGNMVSNNGWDLLMTNLTPARMLNIIKNLIGE